jgi:hypothetical protein
MSRTGPPAEAPAPLAFVVVHRRTQATKSGLFTPQASVELGPAAAVSKVLAQLSARDLQTLIAVLSLVSANGHINPTSQRVAEVLRIPRVAASIRLHHLAGRYVYGQRVLHVIPHRGFSTFVPSESFVGLRLAPLEPADQTVAPALRLAGRERVIELSRKRFANNRVVVEQSLAERHGWVLPSELQAHARYTAEPKPLLDGEDLHVRSRLIRLGVEFYAADALVRTYGRDACARQIAVLPYRKSASPTKLLIASIQHNYAPPPVPAETKHSPEE